MPRATPPVNTVPEATGHVVGDAAGIYAGVRAGAGDECPETRPPAVRQSPHCYQSDGPTLSRSGLPAPSRRV